MKLARRTVFTWHEWSYTAGDESLFSLTPDELFLFRLFIKDLP